MGPLARKQPAAEHSLWHWGMLLLGILAVSTASVLIRLAQAPTLVIGAWRLLLASLFLTPWALGAARREWGSLPPRSWLFLALSGLALAIHFATWISSLAYTTVASSVILVSTNPLFVGLGSHYLLGERMGKRRVLAIAIAMVGTVIVSYGDLSFSGRALLGDGLALLGAEPRADGVVYRYQVKENNAVLDIKLVYYNRNMLPISFMTTYPVIIRIKKVILQNQFPIIIIPIPEKM